MNISFPSLPTDSALLQSVLNASRLGISYASSVRNQQGELIDFEFTLANSAFDNFAGQTMVGKRFNELVLQAQVPRLFQQLNAVVQTSQPLYDNIQYEQIGLSRWVEVTAVKLEDGVMILFNDITSFKQIQEQQRAWLSQLESPNQNVPELEEMQASLRQRSKLLRSTAHDLRGHFGIIAGATQLLSLVSNEAERSHITQMLLRNINQVTAILTDLLDYARLEAGQEERKLASFDAAQLLQELGQSIEPVAQMQTLSVQMAGVATLLVEGDALKLRRITQNLVLNALKHTHTGGITITWGADEDMEVGRWWFCVTDTGPGLPPKVMNALSSTAQPDCIDFMVQPPELENSSLAAKAEGWASLPDEGIGLSIVQQLSQLLEAQLHVRSETGVGTRFMVSFPRHYQ